jgi:hypothetical protein
MFPVADWLDGTTLPGIASYLINGPLTRNEWIEADAVTRLSGEHAARRADHHVRLWQLLSLDSWHRRYLGGESHEEQTERLAHGLGPLAQAGVATPRRTA